MLSLLDSRIFRLCNQRLLRSFTSFHSQRRLGTDYVLSAKLPACRYRTSHTSTLRFGSRIWYGYALSARLFAFPFGLRTPKRSSSLAKLTLSLLDLRIPFRRLMQIRLMRRSQQIELVRLRLKISQKPSINLLYQRPLKTVCD